MEQEKEQEIDLIKLIIRLWKERYFILKITSVFIVLGVFFAIFSHKSYTSSCVFVPQLSNRGSSSMSSLAALAGISVSNMGTNENITPYAYPKVLENVYFLRDLMNTKIKFSSWQEPVTLLDYYTKEEYKKFSIVSQVKKYTIGLPGVLIGLVSKLKKGSDTEISDKNITYDILVEGLSSEEAAAAASISGALNMTLDDKKGDITITARMPEALASAQLCQATYNILQKYVTDFRVAQASANLGYIEGVYKDAKADFLAKQESYATISDANRGASTKLATMQVERARSEYEIARMLYNELTQQLLQANLKVKQDTPIFTAVKPVSIPGTPTKPKRAIIIVIWTFLGVILSSALVFGLDFLKDHGSKWPKKWETMPITK